MTYTDYEFCSAERRGGVYGLTVHNRVYALMKSGEKLLLPAALADQWRVLPLEEPAVIDQWTIDDILADLRRQRL